MRDTAWFFGSRGLDSQRLTYGCRDTAVVLGNYGQPCHLIGCLRCCITNREGVHQGAQHVQVRAYTFLDCITLFFKTMRDSAWSLVFIGVGLGL